MGLYENQVEELISSLIADDFLNEGRYAITFAGGKFRIKGWGKVKIKYELKRNGVSDYCIRKALQAIDNEAYINMLEKQMLLKGKALETEKNLFIKKNKIRNYLLQKGFENDLINDTLHKIN